MRSQGIYYVYRYKLMMAKITQFTCENMTKHVVGIMSKKFTTSYKIEKKRMQSYKKI